ncbi:MAG: hypothetical protein JXX28_05350 [Deltaproteobacteria bacterium]|nr:hypothetical protein [Deltaproteobacteria bacterium]
MRVLLLTALLLSPGCLYRAGGQLTAGVLDEAGGKGQTEGLVQVGDPVAQRQLFATLGHQLGKGISTGVTEITPEEQAALEAMVDGVLRTASAGAATGVREELSPALRAMIRDDVISALSAGLRGELGDSLEETVAAVIVRASGALQLALEDPALRMSLADTLRDAVFLAMREGRPGRPGVGEMLQSTVHENLLIPVELSAASITETVGERVDRSARRTEATLQAIIGALVVVLGVVALLFWISRKRLMQEREDHQEVALDMKTVAAVLDQLDEATKAKITGKVEEYRAVVGVRAEQGARAHKERR